MRARFICTQGWSIRRWPLASRVSAAHCVIVFSSTAVGP